MEFTHFDDQGNALMVDVGDKAETKREAVARGSIFMSPQCLEKVAQGTMAKGDVLGVARVAGIMGAKRTSELIPLCHILNLTKLTVDFTIKKESNEIEAVCTARPWISPWKSETFTWNIKAEARAGNSITPDVPGTGDEQYEGCIG